MNRNKTLHRLIAAIAMEDGQITQRRIHVAILPSPGMGHIIPLVGFAKRLAANHSVDVTLIATSAGPPSTAQLAYLHALPEHIHTVHLPPTDVHDLPKQSRIETVISHTVVRSLPALRDALRQRQPAVLVVDSFCTPAFDVARELGVRPYIFFTSTCTALSLFLHLPNLDRMSESEYRDWPNKIRLPGCVPLNGSDLLDPVQDRKDEAYSWMLRHTRRYPEAEGIFVNSFADIESGPITGLNSTPGFPPVYPIGPLIQSGTVDAVGSQCMKWLDEQPAGSVLFVSFGSGGTLSAKQTAELALGLELSEQRFLWVVRSPSETESNAAFLNEKTQRDPLAQLPDGFLRRTVGAGLVVPSWAPQVQVLGHAATGGFLTHCGWNSTLESVVEGVPLIAWPLYAEQKMNAVMLAEEVGVALRPAGVVVGREEVARVVKSLMAGVEGKRLGSRMKELKDCAARALAPGGSSDTALSQVVSTWKED